MFDKDIDAIKVFLKAREMDGKLSKLSYKDGVSWPDGGGRNIIFKEDVGVEIGNPAIGSLSFIVWTDDPARISDGKISVVGPDLFESKSKNLPFAKIILANVHGFDKENAFERYRELESIRYDVDLKGYMMKGMSQYQREWSRISQDAIKNGFSFQHLGNALLQRFREKDYVDGAEAIFVTSSKEDVLELKEISVRIGRVINAMNKMLEEMSLDCDSCEYEDVCDEVRELKEMRDSLKSSKISTNL